MFGAKDSIFGGKDLATIDAIGSCINGLKLTIGKNNGSEYDINQYKVFEPEMRGNYLKKYLTYLVRQEPDNYKVRRRFSDFEWLHTTLMERYIGILIPSLPEKNAIKTDSFIKSRIRGLNIFMEQLSTIPYIRSDASFLAFLSIQEDKEWEIAKKDKSIMDNAGIGHLKWLEALHTIKIPDNAERMITDVKLQLDGTERYLSELSLSTKRLAEKSMIVSKETIDFKTIFNNYKQHEQYCMDNTKVENVIKVNEGYNKLLIDAVNTFTSWSNISRNQSIIYDILLHENIRYLLQQIKDYKELLKQRDHSIQHYEKLIKTKKNQDTSPSKIAYSQEAEAHSNRLKFSIDMATRALFFTEFEQFNQLKDKILQGIMGQLAVAELKHVKKISDFWNDYIKNTKINMNEMEKRVKVAIESSETREGIEKNEE